MYDYLLIKMTIGRFFLLKSMTLMVSPAQWQRAGLLVPLRPHQSVDQTGWTRLSRRKRAPQDRQWSYFSKLRTVAFTHSSDADAAAAAAASSDDRANPHPPLPLSTLVAAPEGLSGTGVILVCLLKVWSLPADRMWVLLVSTETAPTAEIIKLMFISKQKIVNKIRTIRRTDNESVCLFRRLMKPIKPAMYSWD